jgi:selenocysteine lyase/cysteine desulfurase
MATGFMISDTDDKALEEAKKVIARMQAAPPFYVLPFLPNVTAGVALVLHGSADTTLKTFVNQWSVLHA